ncbi:hypothetical protein [Pseudomonas fragi]|uniref:Outer membrane porin n=1 Tax=Pseudomonas fragi TaxID=296 RepID=A0A449IKP2_PSEFR|nr:hypothetical protein [Pseudomonas fragi]VFB19982.1 outer membrane porin [Pseudomonas fragi]
MCFVPSALPAAHRQWLGLSWLCCSLASLSPCVFADSQQDQATGLIDGSHLNLMLRNFYFNRDYRNGAANSLGTNTSKPLSQRNGYRGSGRKVSLPSSIPDSPRARWVLGWKGLPRWA